MNENLTMIMLHNHSSSQPSPAEFSHDKIPFLKPVPVMHEHDERAERLVELHRGDSATKGSIFEARGEVCGEADEVEGVFNRCKKDLQKSTRRMIR